MVDSAYFVKSTPLRAFIGSFQHFVDMLQTYWSWKLKFDAEKNILTKWQGFEFSGFTKTASNE